MKKIRTIIMCTMVFIFLVACESNDDTQSANSGQSENVESEGVSSEETVTEISIKDLNGVNGNSYIAGVENQFAVVGYQGSFTKSISYDSDVIKDIEVKSGDVNTMIEGDYPLSFEIMIDVNAFCEKEGKQNGITGDTLTLTYDSTISIINREFADSMIANGAEAENILGY